MEKEKIEGNLLIGQGGASTVISNVILAGVLSKAKQNKGFHKSYGLSNGFKGMFGKELIDFNKEDDSFLEDLKITSGSILGSSAYKIKEGEKEEEILEFLKSNDIKYFIYIGNQDDMKSLEQVSKIAKKNEYKLQVVGIPKEIENTFPVTDHCPAYASAAKFVARSTISAGRALEASQDVNDVVIMEVLGKETGWLAAASSLGRQTVEDAPHLIYLPEIKFDEEKFLLEVKDIQEELGFAFVVISEGIRDADGQLIGEKDPHGASGYLKKYLQEKTKLNVQVHNLAKIQRYISFESSDLDVEESFILGEKAVTDIEEGWTDIVLTLDRASGDYFVVPGRTIFEEANKEIKHMPEELINLGENFVNNSYYHYAYPLLGEKIPHFARLSLLTLVLDYIKE